MGHYTYKYMLKPDFEIPTDPRPQICFWVFNHPWEAELSLLGTLGKMGDRIRWAMIEEVDAYGYCYAKSRSYMVKEEYE